MIATATLTWLALTLADEPTVALERIDALHTEVFVGEPVGLRLSMTFDATMLDEQLVSLYRRPLDLPVELVAPWLAPDALPVDWIDVPMDAASTSLVVRGNESRAQAQVDGDTRTFIVERWFVAREPGLLEFAGPELRYAFATSFRDDLVSGRVPENRREASVAGAGLELGVRPRPPAPDPLADLGATGPVEVLAEASRLDADVGEVFTLTLTLRGTRPLHECVLPPSVAEIAGFDVVGTLLSAPNPTTRTIAIDLARTAATTRVIPALEFSAFDPTPPEGHRRLGTAPIELNVPMMEESDEPPRAPERPAKDETPGSGTPPSRGVPWVWAIAGVLAGWLLGTWRRRSRGSVDTVTSPTGNTVPAHKTNAPEHRLLTALSKRTGLSGVALIRPALGETLVVAGLDADVSRRSELLVEQIVATRYGGAPLDASTERQIDDLISEIETF